LIEEPFDRGIGHGLVARMFLRCSPGDVAEYLIRATTKR
jgi:hypothetical protein